MNSGEGSLESISKIAVVQPASGPEIEHLFRTLTDRWRTSLRLAGVVAEGHGLADRACRAGFLRSLASGERFPMFQDLGPQSTACHLDGAGVTMAAEAVRTDIAHGCDLVVLSKFGKLEAAGGGLRAAFDLAIEAGLPVLTSVGRNFQSDWEAFASPLFVVLPPDPAKVEQWRRDVRPSS
jgi:hypothetical protein